MAGICSYYGLGTNMVGEMHVALGGLHLCSKFGFPLVSLEIDFLVLLSLVYLGFLGGINSFNFTNRCFLFAMSTVKEFV